MSHVLIALAKCPPSICAQSDVKSLLRRSATGSGCFGAAFWRAVLLGRTVFELALVVGLSVDLGGMVDVENVRRILSSSPPDPHAKRVISAGRRLSAAYYKVTRRLNEK